MPSRRRAVYAVRSAEADQISRPRPTLADTRLGSSTIRASPMICHSFCDLDRECLILEEARKLKTFKLQTERLVSTAHRPNLRPTGRTPFTSLIDENLFIFEIAGPQVPTSLPS